MFQLKIQQLTDDNRFVRRKAVYEDFLRAIQPILPNIKPISFISYAWYSVATPEEKRTNDKLQARLKRIVADLGMLGVNVFLDINDMHNNMRTTMREEIRKSDYVFLIGTKKLKEGISVPTSNVAFEYLQIQTKISHKPDALLPLLFDGEFGDAYPSEVFKNYLVRDLRKEDAYEGNFAGMTEPMGVIPNIFKLNQLQLSHPIRQQYLILWEKLKLQLAEIDREYELKPEIPPRFLLAYAQIKFKPQQQQTTNEYVRAKFENKNVAVKFIKISSSAVKDRFVREANIMNRINNPNILNFYGVCTELDKECFVMEDISTTLHDIIQSHPLSNLMHIDIALDIAKGLLYLHTHPNKILHKNLNSRNIRVELDNQNVRVKISGFEIADINTNSIMPVNRILIALAYTAPEVLENKAYTENADIYSFGIIIWEMISRKNAQPNLMNGNPADIFNHFPDLFTNLIKLCCDKKPDTRPKSQDIINYLENAKQTLVQNPITSLYAININVNADVQNTFAQAKAAQLNNNHSLAFDLYKRAADLGNIDAIANVGSYLVQGLGGIPIDKPTGHQYLLTAAHKGQPRAQYNLAQMLEFGDGCTQDLQQSNYWYSMAANQTIDEKVSKKATEKLTILRIKI